MHPGSRSVIRCPRLVAAAAAILMLGACARRPRGDAFRPAALEPGQSILYLFREPKNLRAPPVSVLVDQQPVGRLGPGRYLPVVVEPGVHYVRVEGSAEAARAVTVVEGASAYVRIDTRAIRRRLPLVDEPDAATGRRLISETVRAEPTRPDAGATGARPDASVG